jgi:CubicO group peptidase (beta-lactamase class C family)
VRYGLGVSVLNDPAQAGNLGSRGQFGWPGFASTWFVVDPKEDLIALLFTQSRETCTSTMSSRRSSIRHW